MSTRVAVCISTFHRPEGLRAVLRSIAALEPPSPPVDLTVVVVNNDPADAEPGRIIDQLREELAFPVVLLAESERGLSAPRNRAIDFAAPEHEFIAFIDDDSTAEPRWLARLLDTARATGAEVVTGPVTPVFEVPPPAWLVAGGFFASPSRPTGAECSHAFTNNVLIAAEFLQRHELRFDLRLGLTGGEDTHFFRRLRRAGGRIVWAADALVHDAVPAERASARWLVRRHVRTGMSTAWIDRDLRGRWRATPGVAARSLAWAILGTGLLGFGLVAGPGTRVRARCWLGWSRGLGLGLFGRSYAEYLKER
jgi:succinoglycan biosynthesis protein ExoM